MSFEVTKRICIGNKISSEGSVYVRHKISSSDSLLKIRNVGVHVIWAHTIKILTVSVSFVQGHKISSLSTEGSNKVANRHKIIIRGIL